MGKKWTNFDQKEREGLFGNVYNDLIAMAGEFVGTVLFLLFALGASQSVATNLLETTGATPSSTDAVTKLLGYFYISAAFGLSLFAMASIFYRFTGSIFIPSVGLALVLCGVIKPVRFVLVSLAQLLGGIVAASILDGLTPGPLAVSVTLAPGMSRTQGLFIEMFATAALTMSVLMLAAEKHLCTPQAPLGFGLTLWAVMLFSIQSTGGAVNTARAFGPAVISGFDDYHWIYWLGPTLGSLLAAAFYIMLKHFHYWRVNPGQDSTDVRDSPATPVLSPMGSNV
ncbi:aquaporin-like protein [Dioszegia hungarica]|uniref:Aquaporin-like protein n=1 Tax=Dioszegia hungarica TaxID=4972 RepID=A0AA38LRP7_9TREE|nr:aquaporin-like protein [Dioszegia hungarica]KAI9634647.1 aquaporin-like protein [Dioszegia hungarica]